MKFLLVLISIALSLSFFAASAEAQETQTYSYDPLGRVTGQVTTLGNNDGDTRAYCYDDGGNRFRIRAEQTGMLTDCDGNAIVEPDAPPPISTVNDSESGQCQSNETVDVVSNDEGPNQSLILVSISSGSGGSASASVTSSTSVFVTFGPLGDPATVFTYVVEDSFGYSATGQLTVTTQNFGCDTEEY